MFKILSLILIHLFFFVALFSSYSQVEAVPLCSFEITTATPITIGSTITLSLTGENGRTYTALIEKEDGTITPFVSGTLIENNNSAEITIETPNEAGNYRVGVWRTPRTSPIDDCGKKSFTLITDVSQCQGFLGCLSSVQVPGLKFSNQSTFIGDLVSKILPIILGLGGFVSVIIIVISGIQFITSSGNPEAAAAARNRLIFALIGFVIIILAFAITQIVARIFLGNSGVV